MPTITWQQVPVFVFNGTLGQQLFFQEIKENAEKSGTFETVHIDTQGQWDNGNETVTGFKPGLGLGAQSWGDSG